jgi:hypothetical protein
MKTIWAKTRNSKHAPSWMKPRVNRWSGMFSAAVAAAAATAIDTAQDSLTLPAALPGSEG